MKQLKAFITGLMALTAFTLLSPLAQADDMCGVGTIDTHYEGIYCSIRLNDNESADEEIVEVLANQFSMDVELIKEILADNICNAIEGYEEGEKANLPPAIKSACSPSGKTSQEILSSWTILNDIKNAYEKEKVIRFSRASLEFKFKTSEQYWDGKVGSLILNPNDAPFDLIVDLNLIEIVLFGSKAQWMNDVFAFPSDEEEETGEATAPLLDDLLPEDAPEGDDPGFEDTEDPGISVGDEETEEGLPPGCVPLGELNPDPKDNPFHNPELQCLDPEGITFREPEQGDGEDQCPPGSVKSGPGGLLGQEAGAPQEVQQSPEYPGPFLGGTLKQFPESNRPPCGPGESPVDITVAGETSTATDEDDEVICIPTQLCADFNDARDFLFGEGWEDDDVAANIAPAIESLFCVNVIEANRPESPYQLIEGCVDCHITAMVDALAKALETNVSPLVNTTSAFGISSKYGPTFSFNLNTATKAKVKYGKRKPATSAIDSENQRQDTSAKQNTAPNSSNNLPNSPLEKIQKINAQTVAAKTAIFDDTRNFKLSNQVISDQAVGGRVIPLIIQMKDSFASMQSKYQAIIGTTALDQKTQCIP